MEERSMTKLTPQKKRLETVPLDWISIPVEFTYTYPRQAKLESKKAYIRQHGTIEHPLVVHPETQELIDGWASYLALQELGHSKAPIEWSTKKRTSSIRPNKKQSKKPIIPKEIQFEVWEAEDGRCENCKRAMDQKAASFCRVNPRKEDWSADNLHLLCVDCKTRQADFLTNLTVLKTVVQELSSKIHLPEDETEELLKDLLQQNGVIIKGGKNFRLYWIPGIGTFHIAAKPKPTVIQIGRIHSHPKVKRKAQARTRGFPKPNLPINHNLGL